MKYRVIKKQNKDFDVVLENGKASSYYHKLGCYANHYSSKITAETTAENIWTTLPEGAMDSTDYDKGDSVLEIIVDILLWHEPEVDEWEEDDTLFNHIFKNK
jgi:hypothetical protein